MFLLIKVHNKLDSFKLNSLLVRYSLKSIFFAFFLFCFLYLIDMKLSSFLINNIYKLIIELILLVPFLLYFVYKMEVGVYQRMIFLLSIVFKRITRH
jgi:hypothetical protein